MAILMLIMVTHGGRLTSQDLYESQADLLGTLALDLKPTSWLDVNYRVSIARDDYNNKYTQAGITFAPWAIADTLRIRCYPRPGEEIISF